MSSIAERCRTRDSEDENYYSSGSSVFDSNDDSDSLHFDQTSTTSERTDTSYLVRRRRRRSEPAGDTFDSDSDAPSTTDNDNSDSGNDDYIDGNPTHSPSESGTLTSTQSQQDLSQGSGDKHDVKEQATVSDPRASVLYTKEDLLSMNNKDINHPTDKRKQLWWGEGEPIRSQQNIRKLQQDPLAAPPSNTRTTVAPVESSYNQQTRGKQGDWKVPARNRRLDGNQQQRDGRPRQQPSSRSDWRKQLSVSSDGMAASHWTMAAIDQHLLQTVNDEKSWRKKKEEEKREAEWPSLHTNATIITTQQQGLPQGKLKESTAPTSPPVSKSTNSIDSNNSISTEEPNPRSISQEKSGGPSSSQPDKQPHQSQLDLTTPTTAPSAPPSTTIGSTIPQPATLTAQPPTLESLPPTVKDMAQGLTVTANVDKAQQQGILDQVAVNMSISKIANGSMEPATTLPGSNVENKGTPSPLPPPPPPAIKVVLPPATSARKSKHGYLQKRNSELETTHPADATETTTIDQRTHADDAPLLSLKEQLDLFYASKQRQPTRQKCALDQAWWQASESPEFETYAEEQPVASYYYTRPSMMPSSNGTSDSMEWATLPTDDSSDYNRHQIPYTSPSGYHQTHAYFGPSTNLYY